MTTPPAYIDNLSINLSELKSKSDNMKNVLNVVKRRNIFNESYKKRYIEYIKIICIIIFAIICIWICITVFKNNLLSENFLIFLTIIIISIAIIACYLIYYNNISRHSMMIHDNIDYLPMEVKYDNENNASNTKSNETPCPTIACPTQSDGKCIPVSLPADLQDQYDALKHFSTVR
jgi:hypothetical protein